MLVCMIQVWSRLVIVQLHIMHIFSHNLDIWVLKGWAEISSMSTHVYVCPHGPTYVHICHDVINVNIMYMMVFPMFADDTRPIRWAIQLSEPVSDGAWVGWRQQSAKRTVWGHSTPSHWQGQKWECRESQVLWREEDHHWTVEYLT